MKWTLIVMVLGTQPVPTGLVYDDLKACYTAEEAMRGAYSRNYNEWRSWAYKAGELHKDAIKLKEKQIAFGVCIPHN